MLLGYYCYRCSPLLGDRRYIWVEGFFGTHAYLVHKRAVRKIFAYPRLMPVEQQIDALMSQMAQGEGTGWVGGQREGGGLMEGRGSGGAGFGFLGTG